MDAETLFILSGIVGLIAAALGAWVFFRRRNDNQ